MRYNSLRRLDFKVSWGLHKTGLVQDHHVIPRQFKNHVAMKNSGYDMNSSKNIIMMPTRHGIHTLNLRENRLVHEGNHKEYNNFVGEMLEIINDEDEMDYLTNILKMGCRRRPKDIPW